MKKTTYFTPEMTMIATEGNDIVTLSYLASFNGDNIRYDEGRSIT